MNEPPFRPTCSSVAIDGCPIKENHVCAHTQECTWHRATLVRKYANRSSGLRGTPPAIPIICFELPANVVHMSPVLELT